MTDSVNNQKRRDFIKGTSVAAVGAGAMAFPMISTAQTVNMRFQSTWPQKDIFHEYAVDFADKVNSMTGGRLKIEVLPAGAVVKAFDLLDAVNKGTLDGGHGVIAYWYGKNPAVALWGSGPSLVLAVLAFNCLYQARGLGRVCIKWQIERVDFNSATSFVETFEEDVVILGYYVRIPISDFVKEFKRQRIVLIIYESVAPGKLGQIPDRRKGVTDPVYGWKFPDIAVKENRRLPEFAITIWVV